jgi:tryptophanyl-tRNA synthetase
MRAEYLYLMGSQYQEGGEPHCCNVYQLDYCFGNQVKEKGMGETYKKYGEGKICVHNYNR